MDRLLEKVYTLSLNKKNKVNKNSSKRYSIRWEETTINQNQYKEVVYGKVDKANPLHKTKTFFQWLKAKLKFCKMLSSKQYKR